MNRNVRSVSLWFCDIQWTGPGRPVLLRAPMRKNNRGFAAPVTFFTKFLKVGSFKSAPFVCKLVKLSELLGTPIGNMAIALRFLNEGSVETSSWNWSAPIGLFQFTVTLPRLMFCDWSAGLV